MLVGDALGYPIEFLRESEIFSKYGTPMSLFTANGILAADTRLSMRGIGGIPHDYVVSSYMDWLLTQEQSFDKVWRRRRRRGNPPGSGP